MPLSLQARAFVPMWSPDDSGGGSGSGSGGPGDNAPGGGAGGEGDPPGGEPKVVTQEDLDKISAALDAERSQRRSADKAYKDAAAKLKALEDAAKPEVERLSGERDSFKSLYEKAQADLQVIRAKADVISAAKDTVSPNAVFALAQPHLEYDDEGKATNIDAALDKVRESDPGLFTKTPDGGGDGGRGKGEDLLGMNDVIRHMAGRS